MTALLVLVLLPVLIGIGAKAMLRDRGHASLIAAFAAPASVYAIISILDNGEAWSGLAAFLFAPLAIAFALAAVAAPGRARRRGTSAAASRGPSSETS